MDIRDWDQSICPPMAAVAEDSGVVRYTLSHLIMAVSKFRF